MESEEQRLNQLKQEYDEIFVPDSIDDYIRGGMHRARGKKKIRTKIRVAALFASLFIIVMAASIRISPAFASYVSSIPGMDAIVEFIQNDKGLQDVVQNDFIQYVDATDSHDGITFNVYGVIADSSRMVLFYSVKSERPNDVYLQSVDLLDPKGDNLKVAYNFDPGPYTDDAKPENKRYNKIQLSYGSDFQIPKMVTVKAKIQTAEGMWEGTVNVPIDKERFKGMKQELPINETITVEDQKIHFEKAVIYPTRIALHVKIDPDNSKQIFWFEQLKLVDAKGELWPRIKNGVTATGGIDSTDRVIYFQSNYFREPNALYLKGGTMRALDKHKANFVVDLEKEKILQKPDDRLKLDNITTTDDQIKFEFTLNINKESKRFYNLIYYKYHDITGKVYSSILHSGFSMRGDDSKQYINLAIKNEDFQGPLTFRLSDYPARIRKPFKIKIK